MAVFLFWISPTRTQFGKKTDCAAQLNKQLLRFKLYKQHLQVKLSNAAYWIVLMFRKAYSHQVLHT
jgi:hypothetical protein